MKKILLRGLPVSKHFIKKCTYCHCKFSYTLDEVIEYGYDNRFVICPECNHILHHIDTEDNMVTESL